TGSDDGRVHRSQDGGGNWERIDTDLPQDLWVSRVYASHAYESVVYLSLNGYRDDNFGSYVYRSTDRGDTWTPIGTDLPAEPVNVIKEDPLNPALLYVGTDHGLYVSLDTGNTFVPVTELPAVAVHDVVVQEQAKDLIVGTHGRSLYRANVSMLQSLAGKSDPSLAIAAVEAQRYSSRYGTSSWFREDTGPEVSIEVYSPVATEDATLSVQSEDGTVWSQQSVALTTGLNTITYDLTFEADMAEDMEERLNDARKEDEKPEVVEPAENGVFYLRPGTYQLVIEVDGNTETTDLEVK
ncbi:MAG: glycosyl hydrolase, partial [Lewinella sp.]